MELVLAVIGLLEKLFGTLKALLELLRSGREKEALIKKESHSSAKRKDTTLKTRYFWCYRACGS